MLLALHVNLYGLPEKMILKSGSYADPLVPHFDSSGRGGSTCLEQTESSLFFHTRILKVVYVVI